jgi:hypothetical protein
LNTPLPLIVSIEVGNDVIDAGQSDRNKKKQEQARRERMGSVLQIRAGPPPAGEQKQEYQSEAAKYQPLHTLETFRLRHSESRTYWLTHKKTLGWVIGTSRIVADFWKIEREKFSRWVAK